MAAKRFLDECEGDDHDDQQLKQKRKKITLSSSPLTCVKREILTAENFIQNFCATLEPMLRKVVSEEVETGLRRRDPIDWNMKSTSLPIEMSLRPADRNQQPGSCLKLVFAERLSLPIFTGTKIQDIHGNPLRILVLAPAPPAGHRDSLPHSIKVELLVLDGDISGGDCDTFSKNVVRERTGKRPLLAGETLVTLKNGIGSVGEIEFTDNSSWIRGRKFRLGARVVKSQSVRIVEAMTEAFVVKDHRGELYKKNHPPALGDQVWRLEKIGKDGVFHQKLKTEGINTVQDFLRFFILDSSKLRKIMGAMSDKMWESTLSHAKTCVMGTKLYKYHGDNLVLTISPICQIIKIESNGQIFMEKDLNAMQMEYMQGLVKDLCAKWNLLEEVDGLLLDMTSTQLLTQEGGHQVDEDESASVWDW